eukprot:NODE_5775_length_612_cov_29.835052_g5611_i0.p2 GENE.NODE_5775_length_612_cov_29.835052_g5611_i0~~NODE_5775_length_612_cov_29.835052_g5611_i0.p2  ORF type:complete len:127 (+),score=51.58 NODE_5775_length_612_cov_29.835052_g5611_i0:47-382(+)
MLTMEEFAACLKGMGIVVPEDELEAVYKKYCGDSEGITFKDFISFMTDATSDMQTKEVVLKAFKALAKADVITGDELKAVSEEVHLFSVAHMPKAGSGYDYAKNVEQVFLP